MSTDASSGTAVVTRNVTVALRSSVSVTLPKLSQPVDAAVASALARAWATSAATAAGIVGAAVLSLGPPTSAGFATWVARGTSETGVAISIAVVPVVSADGASVAMALTGSLQRSVSSTVAVSEGAWAAGPSAVAAAAAAAADAPGSAASAAAASAAAEVTAAAASGTAAIDSYINGALVVPAFTAAVATALDGEGQAVRAAAARAAGVSVKPGASTSDAATVSSAVVDAVTTPAAPPPAVDSNFWSLYAAGAVCGVVVAAGGVFVCARRNSSRALATRNPLRAGKARLTPPGTPPAYAHDAYRKKRKLKTTRRPSTSTATLSLSIN